MVWLRVLSRRNLSYPSRRSSPNSCLINRLEPLYFLFPTPALCFQQLAASFPKTPGVGVPQHFFAELPFVAPKGTHFVKRCQNTGAATTFRMNTCKSVSKQRTLTTFIINTYEKHRGGGAPLPPTTHRPLPTLPTLRSARVAMGGLELGDLAKGKSRKLSGVANDLRNL